MKGVSVILVYNPAGDQMLLERRTHPPYHGLLDFVGGERELDENGLESAYRLLLKKTGIAKKDIPLTHIMDFAYHTTKWCVQVFAGRLCHGVRLVPNGAPFQWTDLGRNFFDPEMYAGEGYIGHILAHMKLMAIEPGEPVS